MFLAADIEFSSNKWYILCLFFTWKASPPVSSAFRKFCAAFFFCMRSVSIRTRKSGLTACTVSRFGICWSLMRQTIFFIVSGHLASLQWKEWLNQERQMHTLQEAGHLKFLTGLTGLSSERRVLPISPFR